ncbi:MAG TPA: DUF1638 domain-containing protein [Candidatus Limnocylindria bacterium]|nr:DUF1638 domain-containing protein [Candidatus Limnocylindria bacterium]
MRDELASTVDGAVAAGMKAPAVPAGTKAPAVPAGTKAPLVIGCGALAVELVELTRRAGLPAMDLTCLPASLHNRPERIPAAVAARIRRARAEGYDRIFVAYADCGTGGMLDRVLEAEGVARLEGAHCYEVYAGRAAFASLADAEPGTFYLTDFLVRNFDRLVVRGLGLDRHPELLPLYFGNYRRLVYLAQTDDAALAACAEAAAQRLGLAFERRLAGLGELAPSIAAFAVSASTPAGPADAPAPGASASAAPAGPAASAPAASAPAASAPAAPSGSTRGAASRRRTHCVRVRRSATREGANHGDFVLPANEIKRAVAALVGFLPGRYGSARSSVPHVELLPARYERSDSTGWVYENDSVG